MLSVGVLRLPQAIASSVGVLPQAIAIADSSVVGVLLLAQAIAGSVVGVLRLP